MPRQAARRLYSRPSTSRHGVRRSVGLSSPARKAVPLRWPPSTPTYRATGWGRIHSKALCWPAMPSTVLKLPHRPQCMRGCLWCVAGGSGWSAHWPRRLRLARRARRVRGGVYGLRCLGDRLCLLRRSKGLRALAEVCLDQLLGVQRRLAVGVSQVEHETLTSSASTSSTPRTHPALKAPAHKLCHGVEAHAALSQSRWRLSLAARPARPSAESPPTAPPVHCCASAKDAWRGRYPRHRWVRWRRSR